MFPFAKNKISTLSTHAEQGLYFLKKNLLEEHTFLYDYDPTFLSNTNQLLLKN